MGVGPQTLPTITVGASVVQIDSLQLCAGLYFVADVGNSGTVFIGDSLVSTSRYMQGLVAGASLWIPMISPSRPGSSNIDVSKFYAVASTTGQKLHVTFFERLG